MKSTDNASIAPSHSFRYSLKTIPVAWLLCLIALGFAGWLGEYFENVWQIEGKIRYGLQAIVMSGLVVSGIWFIRKYVDQGIPLSIGIGNFKNAIIKFERKSQGRLNISITYLTSVESSKSVNKWLISFS